MMQGYLQTPSYSTVGISMHLTQMETLSAFMETPLTQYESADEYTYYSSNASF